MNDIIKNKIFDLLKKVGVDPSFITDLTVPPQPEMGEFALPVFRIAKGESKKPQDVALEIVANIRKILDTAESEEFKIFEKLQQFGPYVNFFLNAKEVAALVLSDIEKKGEKFGSHEVGKGKKYVIEFACPNPLKAFHLGHLKNLITGESVVRVFENAGYEVVRVNYQGDVGMHVAKALWGIFASYDQFEAMRKEPLKERAEFLGRAYAAGSAHYEESDAAKEEVVKYNDIVYEDSDANVMAVYHEARSWSLEYFDDIYKRLNSHFDRLYFESEMFKRGVELVHQGLEQGVFVKSEGAIIFEGSKVGLHDRVFINSKGFPTYEAKEVALAEKHFADHHPDKVIHVVGKEQTEYFKVVIQAIEKMVPESVGKEFHLQGGFLQLKGDQKMSSRKGNIVTGDELLGEVRERIRKIMNESEKGKTDELTLEKVTGAALKYGMLRSNVSQDVSFDLEESVSVTGDSGPYVLYIVARIKSILRKVSVPAVSEIPSVVETEEKNLLLKVGEFSGVTKLAVEKYDPSEITQYLFELAQSFNNFYHACPVLQATPEVQAFRIKIIQSVLQVMEKGLKLLGIETIEEM